MHKQSTLRLPTNVTPCKAYRGRSDYGDRIHILGAYSPLLSAQTTKAGAFLMRVAEPLSLSSARATDYTQRGIAICCNTVTSVDWVVVKIA